MLMATYPNTDVAQYHNIYNDLRDTTNIPAVIWAAIVSGLALLTVILWFIFHLFNIGSKAPSWFPFFVIFFNIFKPRFYSIFMEYDVWQMPTGANIYLSIPSTT